MSIGMRIAVLLGLCMVLSACSSNFTRFDYPVFGMAEQPEVKKQTSRRQMQTRRYTDYNQDKYDTQRTRSYEDKRRDYSYNRRSSNNGYETQRDIYDTSSTDKERKNSYNNRYQDDARAQYDQRQIEREKLPELRQKAERKSDYNSDYKTAYKTERQNSYIPQQKKSALDAEGRHIVAEGDTLYNISRRYDVTMAKIRDENNLKTNDIKLGQHLIIPGLSKSKDRKVSSRKQNGQQIHRVIDGDTLYSISRRYGVRAKEIADANGIEDNNVKLGQDIIIPGGEKSRSPVRVASIDRKQSIKKIPIPQKRKVAVNRISKNKIKLDKKIIKTRRAGRNQFMWPVGGKILSKFGRQKSGTMNDGVNLAVPIGTKVKAAEEGVVAYAGNELKGYGNLILVRHKDNWVTAYAHNSKLMVKRGDKVRRGQVIARSGKTGSVYEPQLHFELRKGSKPVNPSKYLAMR